VEKYINGCIVHEKEYSDKFAIELFNAANIKVIKYYV